MEVIKEPLQGLLVLQPKVHEDSRGYFMETYQKQTALQVGISDNFIQDNESKSDRGVLRGLHYQTGSHAQSKLIRVVRGAVWDVAVDIREKSPTYGQHFGMKLSAKNKLQMYVPRGFAHGFLVLASPTIFCYKCDNFYKKEAEGGIRFNDKSLDISWPKLTGEYQISDKDRQLPSLEDAIPSKVTYAD